MAATFDGPLCLFNRDYSTFTTASSFGGSWHEVNRYIEPATRKVLLKCDYCGTIRSETNENCRSCGAASAERI